MSGAPFRLDDVISNEELERRPAREPDRWAERYGRELVARELAAGRRRVLQKLSDVALELCRAHSAGITLLEEAGGHRLFRWHAASGQWSRYLWNTLPRELSPCGTVLDRKAAQFMIRPERYFTSLAQVTPEAVEALLIPFSLRREIVGTLWVIAHDRTRRFDRHDRHLLTRLAEFASTACERLSSFSSDDVFHLARLSQTRAPTQGPPASAARKRVLVVDDNPHALEVVAAALQRAGHQVRGAGDGPAAVAMARMQRPDIVLLDMAMRGMSGHEVARALREMLDPGVRIVALTGCGQDEHRSLALDAGCDQVVIKPIDADLLNSLTG